MGRWKSGGEGALVRLGEVMEEGQNGWSDCKVILDLFRDTYIGYRINILSFNLQEEHPHNALLFSWFLQDGTFPPKPTKDQHPPMHFHFSSKFLYRGFTMDIKIEKDSSVPNGIRKRNRYLIPIWNLVLSPSIYIDIPKSAFPPPWNSLHCYLKGDSMVLEMTKSCEMIHVYLNSCMYLLWRRLKAYRHGSWQKCWSLEPRIGLEGSPRRNDKGISQNINSNLCLSSEELGFISNSSNPLWKAQRCHMGLDSHFQGHQSHEVAWHYQVTGSRTFSLLRGHKCWGLRCPV